MLDVHDAHHAASTWREFFIHIATICVGLLIAIGLEQTVEFFHHRHQVEETRRELARERDLNKQRYQLFYQELDRAAHILSADGEVLAFLRTHPHASPAQWPAQLDYSVALIPYSDAAWKTAQLSGVLNYMPHAEVKRYDELYALMMAINTTEERLREPDFRLRAAPLNGELQDQTPAQLQQTWDTLTDVRVLTAVLIQMQHNIYVRYPDFPSDDPYSGDRFLLLEEHRTGPRSEAWQHAMDRLNALDAQDDKQ